MTIDEQEDMLNRESVQTPDSWWEFIVYITLIFGAFISLSVVVSYFFEKINFLAVALLMIVNVVTIGGGALLLGVGRGKLSWNQLGLFSDKWSWDQFGLAGLFVVGLWPLRIIFGTVIEIMISGDLSALDSRQDILGETIHTPIQFMIGLLLVGVLVPIAEELFFRGLIYNWMRQRWGVMLSAFGSAFIFGLGHFDSIGIVIAAFMIGLVLALVYEQTRSLWMSIFIHMINNSLMMLLIPILGFFENLPGF